jgi:hypothetical protein
MTTNGESGGPKLFVSAFVYLQIFCFLSGFMLCATVTAFKRHSDVAWTELVVMVSCLLWTRVLARKVRSKLPQVSGIGYRG